MISSVGEFVRYFEGVRKRTHNFLRQIPPDRIDYTPYPGKFTLGDLIRHLGSTETMFVGAVLDGPWTYSGHQRESGPALPEAVAYLERQHEAAMARLQAASDEVLAVKRQTMQGYPVSAWHLLMAMAEHEVHHRSQISQYLVSLAMEAPQIFGLKIEQVGRG